MGSGYNRGMKMITANIAKRLGLMLVLVSLVVALPGCLAAAGAAGVGTAYALGEETSYSNRDLSATAEAVRQAFEDFGVTYTGTETKPDGMYIRGYKFIDDDTEKVAVGIWDKGEGQPVKLEVRIGTIGKKAASLQLIAAIQKRLGGE